MPEQPQAQPMDQTSMYLSDVNVKLRDIEEKQNLIKDRILLIGENLISEKTETEAEIIKLKTQLKNLSSDVHKIKLAIQRLIESQSNFARKGELEILERQFKMFEPLEFARISDVEKMIKDALEQ
jgi:hypothetical protein